MERISPFVPGVKVAIVRHGIGYSQYVADEVFKVHKNGNFTLLSNSAQQWRPRSYVLSDETGGWEWSASKTGNDHYSRHSVRVWDARLEADIEKETKKRFRKTTLREIQNAISRLDTEDDELINALAGVLAYHAFKDNPAGVSG